MEKAESNKIICKSCGGEFEDTLPKCPFCETFNYKGAEAEYFDKLEDIRENRVARYYSGITVHAVIIAADDSEIRLDKCCGNALQSLT